MVTVYGFGNNTTPWARPELVFNSTHFFFLNKSPYSVLLQLIFDCESGIGVYIPVKFFLQFCKK